MSAKKIILAVAILIGLGVICVLGITSYSVKVMNVPTGAMANTIIPDEKLITTKFYGQIKRGDILVFKLPSDPKVHYVKRVIGLPGEEILVKGTSVFINGNEIPEQKAFGEIALHDEKAPLKILREETAPAGAKYKVFYDNDTDPNHFNHGMKYGVGTPYKIPIDSYFMMGDSRDNSLDSRYWGVVPKANIVSKVLRIIQSPDQTRVLTNLKVND